MRKERRCHHWQENRPVHSFYGTVAGWWIYNNSHWHFEFSFRVLHTQTPLSSFQLYNHFPATGFVRLVQFGFQEQQWSLPNWSTNVHFQTVAPSSEIPSKNSLEDRLKDWEKCSFPDYCSFFANSLQDQPWGHAKWSRNVHFQTTVPSSQIPYKNSLEERLNDREMFISLALLLV